MEITAWSQGGEGVMEITGWSQGGEGVMEITMGEKGLRRDHANTVLIMHGIYLYYVSGH